MKDEFFLAPGARFSVVYRVNTTKDCTVEGVYKGMAMIGTETALVLEKADGILSFINASLIVSMDQLEAAPEVQQTKASADRAFYG